MKEILIKLAISVLAVFAPIQAIIITVGVLIFADLILGIMAAHKRGDAITSAALRRTVTKMFVYQLTILTAFLVQTYLIGGIFPVVNMVAGVIGLVEIKSLLENASAITGLDFKAIIKLLGSKNDQE